MSGVVDVCVVDVIQFRRRKVILDLVEQLIFLFTGQSGTGLGKLD